MFDVWKPGTEHDKNDSKKTVVDIDSESIRPPGFSWTSYSNTSHVALKALAISQGPLCAHLKGVADKYLSQSGRRWVQMSTLFSFMKI